MKRVWIAMLVVLSLASSAFAKPAPAVAPAKLAASAFPRPVPAHLVSIITEAAAKYRVDPNLVAAMAFRESRFESRAVSWRGAVGIMQLMPRTAKALGVKDSYDARQNILGGTKYLAYLLDRFDGNLEMTLAAYNAGPERVAKEGPKATQEAIEYVAAVKAYYQTALRSL
ncbi:MAG TPA: lytic transglycosylase domain-containing protein [Thermoanaerobaculia bacterium]|nr:lytic transglycosylase domain-containing protein [Thermoanaerobaculia bacterium]